MARQAARAVKRRPAPKRQIQPEPEVAGNEYEEMSVSELSDIIEKATAVRASKITNERREFIEETRKRAAMLGVNLSLNEEGRAKRGPKKDGRRGPAEVKYRHGEDSWAGRGRVPHWLSALEAEGRSREEFKV